MNTNQFATNDNFARNQIRTQIGYVETEFANEHTPITGAQAWWDVVLDNFMRQMETFMIGWVTQAINTAEAAYVAANASPNLPPGQTLRTWTSAQTTLNQWRNMVVTNGGQGLRFAAAAYSAAIQLPQPPGGAGGGGTGGGGTDGGGT